MGTYRVGPRTERVERGDSLQQPDHISFVFSYHVVHNPGHSQGIGIYAHRYLRNGRISVSAHVSLCAVVFKLKNHTLVSMEYIKNIQRFKG